MAKRYIRLNWQNKPSVATPISAINLNIMDKGIDDLDLFKVDTDAIVNNGVTTVAGTVLDGRMGKTLQDQVDTITNNLANKLRNDSIANGMTQTYTLTVNALIIVGRGAIGPDAYGMYFVDLVGGIITIHENSYFVVTYVGGVISVTNNIGSNCGIMVIL